MLAAELVLLLVLGLEMKDVNSKDDTPEEGVVLCNKMGLKAAVVVVPDDIRKVLRFMAVGRLDKVLFIESRFGKIATIDKELISPLHQ